MASNNRRKEVVLITGASSGIGKETVTQSPKPSEQGDREHITP